MGHLAHAFTPHGHEPAAKVDAAMETSRQGMRTLWQSLGVLGLTTAVQAGVVALSGSVALLGDTVHNAAGALTAVPLGIAFVLGRRAANRRYTYGYGRAEDLAGIVVVLTIAASCAFTAYQAVDRLLHPREIGQLWAVAGAAAIDWKSADPVVGLLITAAILLVVRDAAREVCRRLMDSVDPALVDTAHEALLGVRGVRGTGQVRMRWIGHALRAEADIVVDPHLTVVQAHALAVEAEHALIHAVPRLTAATVHIDHTPGHEDPHAALAHHAGRTDPGRDRRASAAHMEWAVSRQGGVRDRREGAGDGDSF
ncbi:cation diffusion facilitator family transporter [Streptomyces vinaceus]